MYSTSSIRSYGVSQKQPNTMASSSGGWTMTAGFITQRRVRPSAWDTVRLGFSRLSHHLRIPEVEYEFDSLVDQPYDAVNITSLGNDFQDTRCSHCIKVHFQKRCRISVRFQRMHQTRDSITNEKEVLCAPSVVLQQRKRE